MSEFEKTANKSFSQICEMVKKSGFNETVCQAMRMFFSRVLMDYPEENPLRVDYVINGKHVVSMSQTPCEGYINVLLEGSDDWSDIDCLSPEEQLELIKKLS